MMKAICSILMFLIFCNVLSEDNLDESFQKIINQANIPQQYKLKDIVIGDSSLKNEIVIYTSFTCKHCREFFEQDWNQLYKEYVITKKFKIILRQYIDDMASFDASILFRCCCTANPIDNYLFIFKNYENWRNASDPKLFLKTLIAKKHNINVEQCFINCSIKAGLILMQQEAVKLDIFTSPAFIINGFICQGSVKYNDLKTMIAQNYLPEK